MLASYIMSEQSSIGVGSHGPKLHKGQAGNFRHSSSIIVDDTQVERLEGFVRPTGGVTGDGPFEFVLPAVNDAYLMLGNLSLYIQAKVVKADGSNIDDGTTDLVAPVNCLGTTMWEHVQVLLNDYNINSGSATNAHYKGFIETILSYDATSRVTHLTAQLFKDDTPGRFNTMTRGDQSNVGWTKRHDVVKNSTTFDMMAPITADFLRADKHLAPGNKLAIRLYKARDSFILNSGVANASYKLKIVELQLFYERIRLRENIPPPSLETYLFNRTELKRFPVAQGLSYFNFTLHNGGKMPKSVIIGQVSTAAAEGDYKENPFYFRHCNINQLCLKINGKRVPAEPLRPNFSAVNPLIAREYINVFKNTGSYRVDRGNTITLETFKDGITLFPFDLNIDMCNGWHLHPAQEGTIDVEIGWATALDRPFTILVHCCYDEVISRSRGDKDKFIQNEI